MALRSALRPRAVPSTSPPAVSTPPPASAAFCPGVSGLRSSNFQPPPVATASTVSLRSPLLRPPMSAPAATPERAP